MIIFKKHRNLKYIINRIKNKIYEHRCPESPWLTSNAIEFLENWLGKSDIGFEWGSGRSTLWFSKRVKNITSIEHNISWYEKIKNIIKEKNLFEKIDYLLLDENDDEYFKIIDKYDDEYFDYNGFGKLGRKDCELRCTSLK